VACDPAVTSKDSSDRTAIVAVGLGVDRHVYVLRSWGGQVSPDRWARELVDMFHAVDADLMLGETNNGGDLVESVVRQEWAAAPFKQVRASRGKQVRAEPVARLYEQGKVHHVGVFPELEDNMVAFPVDHDFDDDIDALTYAITELTQANRPLMMGAHGNVAVI